MSAPRHPFSTEVTPTYTGDVGRPPPRTALLARVPSACPRVPAVQEERQRSRERAESEAECAGGAQEGMPVERILEAELAVEPKTEAYGDLSMESSVGARAPAMPGPGWRGGEAEGGRTGPRLRPQSLSRFRPTTRSPTSATRPTSSCSPWWNGPSASPTSRASRWRTRSSCSVQVGPACCGGGGGVPTEGRIAGAAPSLGDPQALNVGGPPQTGQSLGQRSDSCT